MTCSRCGGAVELTIQTLSADVKGEEVSVEVSVPRCSNCKRVALDAKARRAFYRAASDAYRVKHELLTAAEIDSLRRNLGMTWKGFANFVQIGIATLKRWMAGEIQTSAYDSLVRLRADPRYAERAAADLIRRLAETSGFAVPMVSGTVSNYRGSARRRSVQRSPVTFIESVGTRAEAA